MTNGSLNLDYMILPGRCPQGFPALALHNDAFRFWSEFWNRTLHDLSNESVTKADFSRQDAIGVLRVRGQVAALLMHSFFDLESLSARALPYFGNYQERTLEDLRARGVRTVMSMEYLSVGEEFRKKNVGLSLASLVIGLGFELFDASGYDAMIATCRRDLKVDVLASAYGASAVSDGFQLHNVPVVSICTPRENLKPHDDPETANLITKLWLHRRDLLRTGETAMRPRLNIAA